jgi:putative membrane protein
MPASRRSPAGRRPRPIEEIGEPPDPRFTLANERTFLAWTRTSLALVATGLAAVALLGSVSVGERIAVGVPLMLLGAVVAARSYARWEGVERALRLNQPLPYSASLRYIGLGMAALAVLTSAIVILHG